VTSDPAPYTASTGRRFAFTLASAFGFLAALSFWRGHTLLPAVLAILAAALVVAALIAPARLERVERAWMTVALAISRVTTPIFMGIVYFVVLTPVGVLRRALGKSALDYHLRDDSYWKPRAHMDSERARQRMERQF
jgi:DMSO/TMAO reductase YedYZ heme-binding membrane subunit